jgi:hypothetical protein
MPFDSAVVHLDDFKYLLRFGFQYEKLTSCISRLLDLEVCPLVIKPDFEIRERGYTVDFSITPDNYKLSEEQYIMFIRKNEIIVEWEEDFLARMGSRLLQIYS